MGKELNPARPVADEEFYRELRAVADDVNQQFSVALDLAYATGHRINAILHLQWEDVSLDPTRYAPFGTIRWKSEHDKTENEHVTPVNDLAQGALLRALRQHPGIGAVWVFPSPSDTTRPLDRHVATRWFRRAEALAGIIHMPGTGWHSLRRGWASTRKHLPDVDVAAAGGWKDTETMKRCYQHADPEGLVRAVMGGNSNPPNDLPPHGAKKLSQKLSHPTSAHLNRASVIPLRPIAENALVAGVKPRG